MDTSFDDDLSILEHLNWTPWIGDNYAKHRVMIVCESHYDDGDGWLEFKNATQALVGNQGIQSHLPQFSNRRLFQQIERTLLDAPISSYRQRESLWQNVAFFNLVQRLMPSIQHRPTEPDIDEGWRNFLEIATLLKPKVVIKYGYEGKGRLGYILHNETTDWERVNISEFHTMPLAVNLKNGDHQMRIIFTHHPTGARGFSVSKWAEHIRGHFPEVKTLFDIETNWE